MVTFIEKLFTERSFDADFLLVDAVGGEGEVKVKMPDGIRRDQGRNSIDIEDVGWDLTCKIGSGVGTTAVLGHYKFRHTGSSSHLRTMLPESRSCPQPAQRPNHAT